MTKMTLCLARDALKKKQLASVYTNNCKIYVKKMETALAKVINSFDELRIFLYLTSNMPKKKNLKFDCTVCKNYNHPHFSNFCCCLCCNRIHYNCHAKILPSVLLGENPSDVKICFNCIQQSPFFDASSDDFNEFLCKDKGMRWSLNTKPNLLNCNRFKDICNLSNDMLQAFGSVLSSYYDVADFNKLCDEKWTNC